MRDVNYIWADFIKLDDEGRLILTSLGSRKDLKRLQAALRDGLPVRFYDFDSDDDGKENIVVTDGTVHFDPAKKVWLGTIGTGGYRNEPYECAPAWARVPNWHNLPGAMDDLL